jgi:SWI/SNF-related matrix-associated actin-dependent regulator 1 of chromatin subfamily A
MKPFPYQLESLNEIEWFRGRCLLALEQGLGKTPVSLWWLKKHPEAFPVVVVCPASVKYVWERQARKILRIKSAVLEGRSENGGRPARLTIINYDILRDRMRELRRLNPRTIIVDEVQSTKSGTSRRTRAVRDLCRGRPHILALSGTPLLNRPVELFPMLNIVASQAFPGRREFQDRYCGPTWTPWGIKYDGASNTKELHDLLVDSCMIRRLKADVLKDLPDKIRTIVPMPLSDRREYEHASEDFLDWLGKISPEKAKRAARAEGLTRIGHLLRLCARLKMSAMVEWIGDFLAGGEKLVVFTRHVETIGSLRERFGDRSLVIDGSVPVGKRGGIVDRFRDDNGVRLLLGNMQAAGTGIDGLQQSACHVAFAELGWRPADHVQAEDRLHRIGVRDTVWSWWLVAKDTIESKLCKLLQVKQQVLSATLDGGTVEGDLDVYDQLVSGLFTRGRER